MAAVDTVRPGALNAAIERFNQHLSNIETRTYIACLSEHDDSEDQLGRLSMWRGYGHGASPVAIVIRPTAFAQYGDALGAFSSPVAYQTEAQFFGAMKVLPARIEAEAELLRSVDDNILVHMLFQMLLFYAISQKHPGFSEEREWRVLHVLGLHPLGVLRKATESIGGTPQPVLKLPLKNIPEAGFEGIAIP